MRNNCLFILLIAVFVLSGCGKNDNVKTAIGIAEMVRQYETMSYEEYDEQAGTEAEFYHADRFIAEIPNSSLSVVFCGKYDEDTAGAVLSSDDVPFRLQGTLGELFNGITKEISVTELADALSAGGSAKATYEILDDGDTAYYVGNTYVKIEFDSDRDGVCDHLLSISLDESEGDIIKPESTAWLEIKKPE